MLSFSLNSSFQEGANQPVPEEVMELAMKASGSSVFCIKTDKAILLNYVALLCVTLRYVASRYVMLCYVMLYYVVLSGVASIVWGFFLAPCRVMQCNAVLCYMCVMLCCVVSCRVYKSFCVIVNVVCLAVVCNLTPSLSPTH